MTRDLTWGAMYDVAERLNRRAEHSSLQVRAARRRSVLRWTLEEGIEAVDNWTDVFEPVRRRRLFRSDWQDIQPVQQAASNIGAFLRDRPDLGGATNDR